MTFSEKVARIKKIHGELEAVVIISEDCLATLYMDFIDIVKDRLEMKVAPGFGFIIPPDIVEHQTKSKEAWGKVTRICNKEFPGLLHAPGVFIECMLIVFDSEDPGGWIGEGATISRLPNLEFDKSGLLVGPRDGLVFTKDGVLTSDCWIPFKQGMPGVGVTGGFVEALLNRNAISETTHFGLAINPDCVIDRRLYMSLTTRAYIRGPKGLSASRINSEAFPEINSGTVTVHKRVGGDPLLELFPLERTEIMWSQRDGLKTIQIEEIVPIGGSRRGPGSSSVNRYVHAIWDTTISAFIHFDGALREYEKGVFAERVEKDLRSFKGKASKYTKLFRIDTALSLAEWCELTARFFQENELVMEYLGGPLERAS